MRTMCVMCMVCVLGIAATAQAAVLDVGGGGYATIQLAVDAASDGDIINIKADITESNIIVQKSLTFRGDSGVQKTVTGEATGGIFRLGSQANDNKDYVFEDLKLTGGNTSANGGAIEAGNWEIKDGSVTINRCAFVDNNATKHGGAVYLGDFSYDYQNVGEVNITNSTFSGNATADGDAGAVRIGMVHTATVRNTTFSGNSAENAGWVYGGALYMVVVGTSSPVGLVQNSTFVGNVLDSGAWPSSQRGVAIYASGTVDVESCLFADNLGTTSEMVTLTQGGGKGDVSYCVGEGVGSIINTMTNDIIGNNEVADALVGALADNGGPTQTHLPQLGSPAIDAGSNPAPALTSDQRGNPRVHNGQADAGSVETPEPATMGLLGLGSLGMALMRLRRRRV